MPSRQTTFVQPARQGESERAAAPTRNPTCVLGEVDVRRQSSLALSVMFLATNETDETRGTITPICTLEEGLQLWCRAAYNVVVCSGRSTCCCRSGCAVLLRMPAQRHKAILSPTKKQLIHGAPITLLTFMLGPHCGRGGTR